LSIWGFNHTVLPLIGGCLRWHVLHRPQGLKPEDLPEEEQFVTVRKRFSGMRMSGASGYAGDEGGDEADTADSFGFGEGGFYSFHSFRRKAHDFRDKWFSGWNRNKFLPPCVSRTLRTAPLAPFSSPR